MQANTNPVPAISQGGLDTVELLKWELRPLKEEAYGPGCNAYADGRPPKLKMPRRTLEKRIDEILSSHVMVDMAKENTETRLRSEERLGEVVMEDVLPLLVPEDALILYSLRVEGRSREEMGLSYRENSRWGYYHKTTPVAVLPAGEWSSGWGEHVYLDARVDEEDITRFMPERADYLLSTVHKFEVVAERRNAGSNNNGGAWLNGRYYRQSGGQGIHWRIKSGSEKLWKMVALLTGIEEKPGEVRESIVDGAGARILYGADCFGAKFSEFWSKVSKNHSWSDLTNAPLFPDHKGMLILHTIPRNGYDHRKAFLESLPPGYKGFCDKIITEEAKDIEISRISEKDITPYYLEVLVRFGNNRDNAFDRNVANFLLYPTNLFNAMYQEEGFDEFAYKARNEGWRVEHYTLFEWLLASRLSQVLMRDTSSRYVDDLIEVRMKQAGVAPRRKPS